MTHNFCESCNRVRLTCTGTLYMCLGQEDAADLREPLRTDDDAFLMNAIDEAIGQQAQGPRLYHRPSPGIAIGDASYERDRRLIWRLTQAGSTA
jgi:molybdenum cofactor biosynthesis enzyme MoaA